jgi:GNAT superfamily N-acetyltransferase
MSTQVQNVAITVKDKFILDDLQVRNIADILARAFINYPFSLYVFPEEKQRGALLQHYFAVFVRYFERYDGKISVATTEDNKYVGAVLWFDEPKQETHLSFCWHIIRCGMLPVFLKAGWGALRRWLLALEADENVHKNCVSGSHTYIGIIGVVPGFRGSGVGAALVQHVLDNNKPCYIETHGEISGKFWEALGFGLVRMGRGPGGGVIWGMVREPQK